MTSSGFSEGAAGGATQRGLYIAARGVLLDALEALGEQRQALILAGAQAIYAHTGESATITAAPFTTDGDLAIDPSALSERPKLPEALTAAGFAPAVDVDPSRVGQWLKTVPRQSVPSATEDVVIAVDLLVPAAVSGGGRRGARLGIHGKLTAAKVKGLEAVLVDHEPRELAALSPTDARAFRIEVAGRAALMVAKLHKIADRLRDAGRGRVDRLKGGKDVLDITRLYDATPVDVLAASLRLCASERVAAEATNRALEHIERLLTAPDAEGVRLMPDQPGQRTDEIRLFLVNYSRALLREL